MNATLVLYALIRRSAKPNNTFSQREKARGGAVSGWRLERRGAERTLARPPA
jgi:hypothetical protein